VARPSPPAAGLTGATGVREAETGVVTVRSIGCGWLMQSTGFAISPHHVMTLASNVAGSVNGGLHVVDQRGVSHAARVVLFDPAINIAVLDVPTLSVTVLGFASTFIPWSPVAVIGYAHDELRQTVTATVATAASGVITRGIYGGQPTSLQIFLVQSDIAQGEAGGPVVNRGGQVDGIIEHDRPGSHPAAYALSQLQLQSDATESADRSTAVSAGKCVISNVAG
jgi:S1-C subfamily serine protease